MRFLISILLFSAPVLAQKPRPASIEYLKWLERNRKHAEPTKTIKYSHVHGKANGRVIVKKDTVLIEFEIPAVDIFGSENNQIIGSKVDLLLSQFANNVMSMRLYGNVDCATKTQPRFLVEKKKEGHSAVIAKILWNCKSTANLKKMEFTFLKKYPSVKKADVQLVSKKGATHLVLTAKDSTVSGF